MPEGRLKEPTRREFVLVYGGAVVGALMVGLLRVAFDWSRGGFLLAAVIFEVVYISAGLSWLLGRVERPSPAERS